MAIHNIGQSQQAFRNLEFEDWTKKIDLKNTGPQDVMNSDLEGLGQKSFSEYLVDSLSKVNKLQEEANLAVESLASGKTQNIHETMLAVERADMAFRTMNQIRSEVIDAYREVMRMQI